MQTCFLSLAIFRNTPLLLQPFILDQNNSALLLILTLHKMQGLLPFHDIFFKFKFKLKFIKSIISCYVLLLYPHKCQDVDALFFVLEFYLSEKILAWELSVLRELTAEFYRLRNECDNSFPGILTSKKPKEKHFPIFYLQHSQLTIFCLSHHCKM